MDMPALKSGPQVVAPLAPEPKQKAGNELPPHRTVNAAVGPQQTALTHHEAVDRPQHEDDRETELPVRREIEIDPETESMVFKIVDTFSGEVKRQVPDEALLKLRAYVSEHTTQPRVERDA